MEERTSILWFRNDLRLHDNEALAAAIAESTYILPVYCFDTRDYGKTVIGIDRTGPARACFILDCVSKLRHGLRELGSDLVVKVGKPEEILFDLATRSGACAVYAHQEVSPEDIFTEREVAVAVNRGGVEMHLLWTGTLIHIDDLPFELEQMPANFGGFRQAVQHLEVRPSLAAPKELRDFPASGEIKPGAIPTLENLGLEPSSEQGQGDESESPCPFLGGEEAALESLKSLTFENREWSNGDVGTSNCGENIGGSTICAKLSPWLAIGCLSPRQAHEEFKKLRGVNAMSMGEIDCENEVNSLMHELLWRDFFRFITKAYAFSTKETNTKRQHWL